MLDTEDTEILYIGKDDMQIDITQYVYEYLHLALPIHKICDNPGKTIYCDSEIVQFLDKQQNKEDNNSGDPRWNELNKLKDKLN